MSSNHETTLEIGAGARLTVPSRSLARAWFEMVDRDGAPVQRLGTLATPAPKIGDVYEGGVYAGLSILGNAPVQLVLLHAEMEPATWDKAVEWASGQGGALPSRIDQLVLLKNVKAQFKPEAYWSGEQHAEGSFGAWGQDFDGGFQDYWPKGGELRARAVRTIAV